MTPLPNWIPVVVSAAGVVIALCGFIYQIRRARFNQSIDLLFRLENDFFGPAKQIQRSKAATALASGDMFEAEPILDFFETMALLLRRGALDEEMVWHTFFYWVNGYYEACKSDIQLRQQTDPLLWKDLLPMVERLRIRQKNATSSPRIVLDSTQIQEFLREEAAEATR
ncbi:DUF4760 domain-containing protein [Terriglobus saanensis]|uniref:DUF4760 domain-containing protein n=1 Tax=Terriglobus saanensis (strain ATCC BAA-1853 / DSM 23119 / SP1PR4) TaxID=401053 RepID=E8UYB7_TERSS|nr:hypothetical protein AciPR4_1177 [Terriglobus saanensis SP1PR4]